MVTDERVAFAQLLPPLQVGFFGYMSYYDRDIPGDILLSFSETKVAFVLKLCKLLASDVCNVPTRLATCVCCFLSC